jgi:hypothetical protein
MSFCIPYSDYLANIGLYDLVAGPTGSCTGCGIDLPTPAGLNVQLSPINLPSGIGTTFVFEEVVAEGVTTISDSPGNGLVSFENGSGDVVKSWLISTTATFYGSIYLKIVLPQETSRADFDQFMVFSDAEENANATVYEGDMAPNYDTKTIYANIVRSPRASNFLSSMEQSAGRVLKIVYVNFWSGCPKSFVDNSGSTQAALFKPCGSRTGAGFRLKCVACDFDHDQWTVEVVGGRCQCVELGCCCDRNTAESLRLSECQKNQVSPLVRNGTGERPSPATTASGEKKTKRVESHGP